ncbi:hypothetical protein HYX08_01665 [Candidatus Woesearchaeota archaeon]|nr:hypothetical protein [Candidatus Woesearchaeota archaeon]
MTATASVPPILLEEKAYIEFARRKGFSTKTDVDGRPLLRETKLCRGFCDAYSRNEHRRFSNPADQHEYDVGFNGGMFAWLVGANYFKRDQTN